MDKIRSDAEMHSRNGEIESHIRMRAGSPRSDRSEPGGRLRDIGERAGDFAERLREGVQEGFERMGSTLGRRSDAVDAIRQNPLAAVGIAFVTGAAIAAATATDESNWVVERARRRLRALLISGATALLVQELRSIAGASDGFGSLVQSLLDDEEEFQFEDDDV